MHTRITALCWVNAPLSNAWKILTKKSRFNISQLYVRPAHSISNSGKLSFSPEYCTNNSWIIMMIWNPEKKRNLKNQVSGLWSIKFGSCIIIIRDIRRCKVCCKFGSGNTFNACITRPMSHCGFLELRELFFPPFFAPYLHMDIKFSRTADTCWLEFTIYYDAHAGILQHVQWEVKRNKKLFEHDINYSLSRFVVRPVNT